MWLTLWKTGHYFTNKKMIFNQTGKVFVSMLDFFAVPSSERSEANHASSQPA